MRKLLPVVVLALVSAVAVWFFWLRDRGETKKPVPVAAAKGSAAVAVKPNTQRDGNADMQPQRFQIDDDPRGDLRLEGQVIDESDAPVGGVIVVLGSNPPRTATSASNANPPSASLVGRPYTLVASGKGKVAGPVTTQLTAKSDPVVLKLHPAPKLSVEVVGVDGKPIDGATVELRGIDDQREETKAGKAVFATVVPGGYQLAGYAPGLARTFQWIQIGNGDETAKLTLSAGAPVSGRVVDEGGKGVEGARVRFSGASDWSQQASDRHDAAVSAKDGAFTLPSMPAGSFRFVATHEDFAPGTSPLITLDAKAPKTDVTIVMAAGAVVRGRVVDAAKNGVGGARVRLGSVAVNRRAMIFEAPRQAYTNSSGEFELKGVPRRALSVVALHDTGSSATVDVDTTNGDAKDVVLTLDVTGVISGTVVDPQGNPIEGAQVTAGPSFADNRTQMDFSAWRLRGFPQSLSDAGGAWKLVGLAPGQYNVTASRPNAQRNFFGNDGVNATTGETNVKLVLPPTGSIKGKVQLASGSTPPAIIVGVGLISQPANPDGTFLIENLPPQKYELGVRGPTFQTRAIPVTVEASKTADAGTITVEQGRQIAGKVLLDGKGVEGATVFAGRLIFGNGTSSAAQFGPMGQNTKKATTDADGSFTLTGFPAGDITIVAEHETLGRSRGLRLPTLMPGQGELILTLEKFGALTGVLRQGGKPAEGVFVSAQSTTIPGAIYSVSSGGDGAYRFDRLAPDSYKVSATLGMPMSGMKFYSKNVVVPPGKEIAIDLTVEPGSITFDVTLKLKAGELGVANVYLASGTVSATTANELGLKMAAAGAGASQWVIVRRGEPARFVDVVPGNYSMCSVPYPAEVKGMAAMTYAERHGDTLLAFCKPVSIRQSPETQSGTLPVELPPYAGDAPPPPAGPGSGSGSAQ
jgi:large repetitive protein